MKARSCIQAAAFVLAPKISCSGRILIGFFVTNRAARALLQVIFDVLLRKGDLVEKFVAFANKPRLLQRFRERLADYKRFWEGVQVCVSLRQ